MYSILETRRPAGCLWEVRECDPEWHALTASIFLSVRKGNIVLEVLKTVLDLAPSVLEHNSVRSRSTGLIHKKMTDSQSVFRELNVL